jgi:iron complex transport system ATP-binding protein
VLLSAANVSYSYGRSRRRADRVLDDVTVTVERGAVVGILGPNGSGKTTLLKLLAGILHPAGGRVQLCDRDVAASSRTDIARQVAVVPQETRPAFDYSVIEMVLMGRYPHLAAFEVEGPADVRIAREAMAATGTTTLEGRRFDTLSGGEKQRVIIAAALAQAAEILLLDEPTSSLDLAYQLEIADLIVHLNHDRGVTIVLSTHDLNFAASVCRSLVLLRDGRVVASGPTEQVLTPANVRAVYGVEADVSAHAGAGRLTVVPIRRAGAPR